MRQISTIHSATKAVFPFCSQIIGSKPTAMSGRLTSPSVGWYKIFHIVPATISETMSGMIKIDIQSALRLA